MGQSSLLPSWLLPMLRLMPMLDTSVVTEVDTSVDTEAMEATDMEAMVDIEAMVPMATDSTRDLLMLRPRLMLLSLAMVLMDMLPLLPPMLLLLPSPLDMLDMESGRDLLIPKLMLVTLADTTVDTEAMEATAMEDIEAMELMAADSTRDLLMLRLMLLSSMDLMDLLSPPLLSVPMLLPSLTDMEVMEVMDMEDLEPTGKSFPHNKLFNQTVSNSKEDLKFPWM